MSKESGANSSDRLNSWKEIAAFYGRDERTVKRWEKLRGLPVHRLPGSGRTGVFAYKSELAGWLQGNAATGMAAEAETSAAPMQAAAETIQSDAAAPAPIQLLPDFDLSPQNPSPPPRSPRIHLLSTAAALLAVLATTSIIILFARAKSPAPSTVTAHSAIHAPHPAAEELYLKGSYHWHKRTSVDLNQAVEDFQQAIADDPEYAQAYAGLADCYDLLPEYSLMLPEKAYPLAKAAAERAIQLDDHLSEAHSALAFADFYGAWDVSAAQTEFQRALELDPGSASAHHWYATFLAYIGDLPQASQQIDMARALDPDSRAILADKALLLLATGHQSESAAMLKDLEAAEPDFLSPHTYLAYIYLATNDSAGYLAELEKSAKLLKGQRQLAIATAARRGFSSGGRQGMLDAILHEQIAQYVQGEESAYAVAQTSALAGDDRQALEYLSRGLARRETSMAALRFDYNFRTLHSDPSFQQLMAKVGLPPFTQS